MIWLLENPLAIVVAGGLAVLATAVVFASRRTSGALAALVATVLATFAILAVERSVVTDREQVRAAVRSVMQSIEAGDLPALLSRIDPAAASVRSDAQALLPLMEVKAAGASRSIDVEFAGGPAPTALARFTGFLNAIHRQSGVPVMYADQVDVVWARRGDQWLITHYVAYFDGQPIDAVGSARGNRPVPTSGS